MNTSELIGALKIHGSFPTSNDLFSDSDFLNLFNHQMKAEIVPLLLKVNEEYLLQSKDFAIVSGSSYRIPTRAVGSVIRNLQILDAAGNVTTSTISRLYEEDRGANRSGYYMLRNSIELSKDYTIGTLRMKYFARPGTLVLPTACAQITSINFTTNRLTTASVPTNFISGTVVDFVQNTNPYDLLQMDSAIVTVLGTTITFASLPPDLAVGDWLCLSTQSCVPMIPEELQTVLIQSCLCKTLSSKKDQQYKDELDTLMRIKEDAVNMMDPRIEDNTNKVRSGRLLGYFSSRRY